MKVIVSNGHNKFSLGAAAAELASRDELALFISAGYPTPLVRKALVGPLSRVKPLSRLLSRSEDVPSNLVASIWSSELLLLLSRLSTNLKMAWASQFLLRRSMRRYGRVSRDLLSTAGSAQIYHYRSGFGLSSVAEARRRKMVTICDHSIAHPALCEYLVNNNGSLPPPSRHPAISTFWQDVKDDLEKCDHVIVNSDFVKDTFLNRGWPSELIHVVYCGVENEFWKHIEACPPKALLNKSALLPRRIVFAGEFGLRKGAHLLIQALSELDSKSWELDIIGNIDPEIRRLYKPFLSQTRVKLHGYLNRRQLAERLLSADIFAFPSLAEGSARVTFMAMACGCYVITTPNSGSVVRSRENGALVRVGSAAALRDALNDALAMDYREIQMAGERNSMLVRSQYSQSHFGAKLCNVYSQVINEL